MISHKPHFELSAEPFALDFSSLLKDDDEISINKDPMTGDYALLISQPYYNNQRLVIWNPETKKQICKYVRAIASQDMPCMVIEELRFLSSGLISAKCNLYPTTWYKETHFSLFFNDTLDLVADKLVGWNCFIVLSNQILRFDIHGKTLDLMEVIKNENTISFQMKSSLDYSKISPDYLGIQVMKAVRLNDVEFAVFYRTCEYDHQIRICAIESNTIVPKKHLDFPTTHAGIWVDIAFLNKQYLVVLDIPYSNVKDEKTTLHYFEKKSGDEEWKRADSISHDIKFSHRYTLPMPFHAFAKPNNENAVTIYNLETNSEIPDSLIYHRPSSHFYFHQKYNDHFYFPLRHGVYVCVKSEPRGASQKAIAEAMHSISPFNYFPPGLVPLIASYLPIPFDRALLNKLPVISPMKMVSEEKTLDSSPSVSHAPIQSRGTSSSGMFSSSPSSSSKTKSDAPDKKQTRCVTM